MFDEKNVIQINGGIMINVDVSVKRVMYVKKIIFGVLLYVVVKMENIQQVLSIIRLKKLQSHAMKKQKLFQQILMKRKQPVKFKISMFQLHFY